MVPNVKSERSAAERATRPPAEEPAAPSSGAPEAGFAAVESPARRLQLELERSWASDARAGRWSARRSLAFIVLTNGLLWGALIWGVPRIV